MIEFILFVFLELEDPQEPPVLMAEATAAECRHLIAALESGGIVQTEHEGRIRVIIGAVCVPRGDTTPPPEPPRAPALGGRELAGGAKISRNAT